MVAEESEQIPLRGALITGQLRDYESTLNLDYFGKIWDRQRCHGFRMSPEAGLHNR